MAGKGRKMDNAVAVNEAKEVGFTDLELSIKKPVLGKDGSVVVGGNFEELAQQISAVVDKYKGTVLTDENLNYVKAVKTQFQKLRTSIDSKRKDWKKIYLTTPAKLLDAMCDDLQKLVAEGEDSLGRQLDAYDQKRRNELTEVLNGYVQDAVNAHGLRGEYAVQIELKDKYYNKTQKEEDSADDIEAQAVELERKQKEYDAGLALIRAELEDSMLVEGTYLEQLKYRSPSEIVLQIKADKKESQRLYAEMREKEARGEKVILGEPVSDEMKATFEAVPEVKKQEDGKYGAVRERTLWIRYKAEQAQDILDFFTEHGVEFKFLK